MGKETLKELQDILKHEGVSIKDGAEIGSGRYPLGSGENPYQHGYRTLSERIRDLKSQNFSWTDPKTGKRYSGESAIARALGFKSTTEMRAQETYEKHLIRAEKVAEARRLFDEGLSKSEIARRMGYNSESSVRSLLNEDIDRRKNAAMKTADSLKTLVNDHRMVDVGEGIEASLGISKQKMSEALYILQQEGYQVYSVGVNTGPDKQTTLKALCAPDVKHNEVYEYDKVYNLAAEKVSHDGGDTFEPRYVYPASLDSKRLQIRYADDDISGADRDGLIELRRGVPDISLGNSLYSQVRILVDNSHYLKGMAVYADDLPEGIDIRFNTNKNRGVPALGPKDNTVLKPIKAGDNPFGSLIKDGITDPTNPDSPESGGQSYYIDKNGKKKLSLINKRSDEGDWRDWSNKLPSQFLAKQGTKLISQQLNATYADKEKEFNDICQLTNPTVKKFLLDQFADDCDKSAVTLKAKSLPRQKYQVLIPIPSLKDNEIYAPNYKDGEILACVRFPHGGTFEIPILKVNNKNKEGIDILSKTPMDAVGINSKVAQQLSGADFDGDTVMCIPCNSPSSNIKIAARPYLKELKNPDGTTFDPKMAYGGKKEGTFQKMRNTQTQMGIITNLIADMTLKGAPDSDIAKAVKHSMVVIDAEKHGLDYKQSEKDNDIPALKKKWQNHIDIDGNEREGASTLITLAKNPSRIPKRQGRRIINEDGSVSYKTATDLFYPERAKIRLKDSRGRYLKDENGDYVYKKDENGRYLYDYTGKTLMRTQEVPKMSLYSDARALSSGTVEENLYADYANKCKSLANKSRKIMINTKDIPYSKEANVKYKDQVNRLTAALKLSQSNAPLERRAQSLANCEVKALERENPDMSKSEKKKKKQMALTKYRTRLGAQRHPIDISDKEWEAIQSGAISKTKLEQIMRFADIDKLKQLAMPREMKGLTNSQIARANALAAHGYTNEQIANALGVSASTVSKNIKRS